MIILLLGLHRTILINLEVKFNVRDSLMMRIDNVRATGFDEIVVEYFGQNR